MRDAIFFDHAATTPCTKEAVKIFLKYSDKNFANPSSLHGLGVAAARIIKEARAFFCEVFCVDEKQVIFTSGGTESDNLALYGCVLPHVLKTPIANNKINIIVSALEHPAVMKTALSLKDFGVEVQIAPVNSYLSKDPGQIDQKKIHDLVNNQTVLVSVQQVNNIIGVIQPIEELSVRVKSRYNDIVFHSDAVQSFGKIQTPIAGSGVDLLSISSHKVGGPKGVGALIILNKKLINKIRPIIWGGGQEFALRSGTQSPGLVGAFYVASKNALGKLKDFQNHTLKLREQLRALLKNDLLLNSKENPTGRVYWNSPEASVSNIISLSVPGCPSGALINLLEEGACVVSAGSACDSKKEKSDLFVESLGLPNKFMGSTIRISFGNENSSHEVEILAGAIKNAINRMSGLFGNSLR